MCTSKPKAPPPKKEQPLRVLLSRDMFDKMGGKAGAGPRGMAAGSAQYLLPPRVNAEGSAGLAVGQAGLNLPR